MVDFTKLPHTLSKPPDLFMFFQDCFQRWFCVPNLKICILRSGYRLIYLNVNLPRYNVQSQSFFSLNIFKYHSIVSFALSLALEVFVANLICLYFQQYTQLKNFSLSLVFLYFLWYYVQVPNRLLNYLCIVVFTFLNELVISCITGILASLPANV